MTLFDFPNCQGHSNFSRVLLLNLFAVIGGILDMQSSNSATHSGMLTGNFVCKNEFHHSPIVILMVIIVRTNFIICLFLARILIHGVRADFGLLRDDIALFAGFSEATNWFFPLAEKKAPNVYAVCLASVACCRIKFKKVVCLFWVTWISSCIITLQTQTPDWQKMRCVMFCRRQGNELEWIY